MLMKQKGSLQYNIYLSKDKGYCVGNAIKNVHGQWRTVCCVLFTGCHGDSHNNITAAYPGDAVSCVRCT
jgi:hypothetical protein